MNQLYPCEFSQRQEKGEREREPPFVLFLSNPLVQKKSTVGILLTGICLN